MPSKRGYHHCCLHRLGHCHRVPTSAKATTPSLALPQRGPSNSAINRKKEAACCVSSYLLSVVDFACCMVLTLFRLVWQQPFLFLTAHFLCLCRLGHTEAHLCMRKDEPRVRSTRSWCGNVILILIASQFKSVPYERRALLERYIYSMKPKQVAIRLVVI